MLVSPKWETMWMESRHSSKTTINVPLPSQQAKKLLEDLKGSCCSPNKAVQLEALKCWGAWINGQNQEDWKLNTLCYTAVRPLLIKKLQPLQRDVDICKLRFSLMWALLRKVQNIMQLEGPQYILEVFVQYCLNWLSSCAGDGGEEITELIFQLLLAVLCKEEALSARDKEMFQPLSVDIFKTGKVFNRLADKVLSVLVYWRKAQDKNVILKLWRHFLGLCELSREHVAVPVWHKVFKLIGQMCSEKSEPVKERLGLLHGCAITLKPVLSSSKFLDCGNLLLTPCEALLKKLMELGCSECEEFYDPEMFVQALEVSKVLSVESVGIGGYALGINVLNLLDEFSLRSLYWGVWCGLVHCYESLSSDVSKVRMNFYRKLRGVAINFELDKARLGEECIAEVERCIRIVNVCLCSCLSTRREEEKEVEVWGGGSLGLAPGQPGPEVVSGRFPKWKKAKRSKSGVVSISFGLVNQIVKTAGVSSAKWILHSPMRLRFVTLRVDPHIKSKHFSLPLKSVNKKRVSVRSVRALVAEHLYKKALTYAEEKPGTDEVEESVRKTRSQRRAEEEKKKKERESQKRKTRKSFEIRVQEIVQKNKERKSEKNCSKSPLSPLKGRRKMVEEESTEVEQLKSKKRNKKEKLTKLENYFKVIKKNAGNEKRKKKKKKEEGEKKEDINWKQRSLKTMMMQGKEARGEGVVRRRKEKEKEVGVGLSSLAKLSPFKEVLHDHEYARMEYETAQELRASERKTVPKEELEKKTGEVDKKRKRRKKEEKREREEVKEGLRKSRCLATESAAPREAASEEARGTNTQHVENVPEASKKSMCVSLVDSEPKVKTEVDKPSSPEIVAEAVARECSHRLEKPPEVKGGAEDVRVEGGVEEAEEVEKEEGKCEDDCRVRSPVNVDDADECAELDSTPRRGRKRCRILDSLKPSKKAKVGDPEENLGGLEVEKENLEEVVLMKEEKSSKGSPKTMGGMISSRTLRMIALVPESGRSQVHWETSPRVEVKKKGPNVDKNSRASKMLALLSENVVIREVVEAEEMTMKEVKSNGDAVSNFLLGTPTSSLKSPRSVKQRRSIRFDDTKNETVVYETDTPPSQVLEGKERWRRVEPLEATHFPHFTAAK